MSIYPPIHGMQPIWTGKGFQVGNEIIPVLSYGESQSGWNDDLTILHEETAGSDHFIDLASRTHAVNELSCYLPASNSLTIIDIGCSSGYMIRDLREKFQDATVLGADVVLGPLERLSSNIPDIPLLHFDLTQCPLPDACLDGVTLLNVLEHIEDDHIALMQVFRILKPGGVAVIEVPAGPGLMDSYDRRLMHHRRYRLRDLVRLCREAGFCIQKKSHLGVFFYPGFWLVKKKNRLLERIFPAHSPEERSHQDETAVSQEIRSTGNQAFLRKLITLELTLGRHISYPFGIRCLLTLQKV